MSGSPLGLMTECSGWSGLPDRLRMRGRFDRALKYSQARLNLIASQTEGRAESDGARTAGEQEETPLERVHDDPIAQGGIGPSVLGLDLDADHQATTANLADCR